MQRKLTILYGSETGCAQDLAEHIWRESKKYHFEGQVLSMDKYDVRSLLTEEFVVFACSTTGQGEEPSNMKTFWKFLLRKSLPSDSLSGMHFAVIGQGDSSYQKFNFAAKRLNRRLLQLGAKEIIPIGLCDEQHDLGISAVSVPWIQNLWDELLKIHPLPKDLNVLDESPRIFRWNINILNESSELDETRDIYENFMDSVFDRTAFTTELLSNTKTTAEDHFQDVRLLSFDATHINWIPGDVVTVRPQNSDANVNDLFKLFAEHNFPFNENTIIQIEEIDSEMLVPDFLQTPLTLKTICKQYWDLSAVPRGRAFELLALNCKNELEKEKLIELSSPEGQEELYSYANRPRRSILEVLYDFNHSTSQLTLPVLFELFQSIKARSFSIASCAESKKLEILVAVVEYKTMLAKKRKGLCSNWLKELQRGDKIRAVIKKGTFKFPKDENIPIVMVGPGTGLAPFRSLLMQIRLKWQQSMKTECKNTLFFGCRGEKSDFHCKNDLNEMVKLGMLKLFTAFSRDQEDKIYVQHRIEENAEHLRREIIENGGYFYLAGNSKNMPAAVKESLQKALNNIEYVDNMIKLERYQEETWS